MQVVWKVLFGLLRIWLGFQWLEAGLHKLSDPRWVGPEAGTAVTGFFQGVLAKAAAQPPLVKGWYAAFIRGVAMPNAVVFSYLIAVGEVLAGLGLILGVATVVAAAAGAFMNLNFLLAGTISSNPILLAAAVVVLLAGPHGRALGLDPYLSRWLGRQGWLRPRGTPGAPGRPDGSRPLPAPGKA